MNIKDYTIPIILTGAYSMSVFTWGIVTPLGFCTVSSVALGFGLVYALKTRASKEKPLIPMLVLTVPVVMASICYYALGTLSLTVADNLMMGLREMIQRILIIVLPTLVFALVPRKPSDLKFAILSYLPLCAIVALAAFIDGRHNGFTVASYTLGMHKNQIAGSCSVMGTIAIAALLTTNNLKKRLVMIGFLGISLLGCIGSQGRAGLMCIVVATMFMLIASKAKIRNILYFVVTVALIGGLLWKAMPQEAMKHMVSTEKFSSNEVRLSLWTEVVPALVKDPFFCVGWGQLLVKDDRYFGDCANVLLFDWFQLTLLGPILLLSIIFLAIKLALDNAKRLDKNSLLGFINLVALGVICGRFTHAMLDTFWIGRGVTLVTWASIGIAVFVKLYLDQTSMAKVRQAVSSRLTSRFVKLPGS